MPLPALASGDFSAFFQAIQQWDSRQKIWVEREAFDAFPWQARLIHEIAEEGRWPDLLDLPTGSGKTVAIDIAVFHLALQADEGEARRAAMRVAFVVDRRLVVDEAFSRAERLAAALLDASRPDSSAPAIVRVVATRLRRLAGDDRPPLIVRPLRGGAPREDDWARTPCQPTVLCSTVDQVGSRLLFRGYGVSDSMRPVQAGLLGSDALILLDEAHLSQPFRQTVQAIARHVSVRGPDTAPFQVALLTATAGAQTSDEQRFELKQDDRDNPILARRLQKAKPTTLHAAASGDRAKALAEQACKLIASHQQSGLAAPVVGVIANRVGRARAAFELLKAKLSETADMTLVIGRARSVDRDRIAKELDPIKTGVEPRPGKPFIVVATQTLEAGVDIDLDALVTDAASLDALRQRFGRVNRDGREIGAMGVVIADKVDRNRKKPDPVYGEAIASTLGTLFPEGKETVDFGIGALNAKLAIMDGDAILEMLSDKADAPVLMPAYADLWSHTAPIPAVDPDPALFLHGPNREPASVQLVWRADLDFTLGNDGLKDLLSLTPPRAAESIELPVWTVRRWLLGETGLDLADVAQVESAEALEPVPKGPAFCWRGADDDRSRIVEDARTIRSGDMIVVPSSYGGCDEHGWNPHGTAPTPDAFDAASHPWDGKRYVVRIAPGLIRQAIFEAAADPAAPSETAAGRRERLEAEADRLARDVARVLGDPSARAKTLIEDLLTIGLPATMKERLEELRRYKRRLDPPAYPYGGEDGARRGVVLRAPFGIATSTGVGVNDEGGSGVSTEDDETGSFVGQALTLAAHSGDVSALARIFAERSGLPDVLAGDIALAGWLHDAGKADIRFQRLLFNGDLLALEAKGEALAKSEQGRSPPGAWERAGLPPHWRHEALSVRLAMANCRLQRAHDRALVLWLVGVHHGHGRPFFPHADTLDETTRELAAVDGLAEAGLEAGTGPQSLAFVIEGEAFGPTERDRNDLRGLDWATMFRDLKHRYGPWGLARLEAVLRLADHRASETSRDGEARA